MTVNNKIVERCLTLNWEPNYIGRDTKSATVKMQFENAKVAKEISTRTLKN